MTSSSFFIFSYATRDLDILQLANKQTDVFSFQACTYSEGINEIDNHKTIFSVLIVIFIDVLSIQSTIISKNVEFTATRSISDWWDGI